MTDLVPSTEIELLVGAKRHPTKHIGKAVSDSREVFIMHSNDCFVSMSDLRLCEYSLALDKGIEWGLHSAKWREMQDIPIFLETFEGTLVPVKGVENVQD